MIEIKVPTVGESINEVTLIKWLKKDGDYVDRDEVLAELESEKATFEVNAEKAGILKTSAKEGDTLNIGDTLAQIDESAAKPEVSKQPAPEKNKESNGIAAAGDIKEKEKQTVPQSASGGPKSTPTDIK